jgi:hypothetical protein
MFRKFRLPEPPVTPRTGPGGTPPRVRIEYVPTVVLTAKSVLALPAPEGGARVDYRDQKVAGLVLRVNAKARTYSVWYSRS